MSANIESLLLNFPDRFHDQLSNYWSDWCSVCAEKGLDADSILSADLLRVWLCSDLVARTAIRDPAWFTETLGDISTERCLDDYQQALEALLGDVTEEVELMRVLRRYRRQESVRIVWRDIAGVASVEQVLHELSDLAEAIIRNAYRAVMEQLHETFGTPRNADGVAQEMLILGMGKLGGRELNFSSDIDLVFCYPDHGDTDGRRKLSNQEYFIEVARHLIRVIDEQTADGFVYRVDTRLRPFGSSGPLVCSLASMENYYQNQGRDWERYAMIKARILTGDEQGRRQLSELLTPFVYRRYLDFSAFESIREMKSMIDLQVKRKGIEHNIKLGRGGIREIEFIGQTFQLIRGGQERALRSRGIIDVLHSLIPLGLLDEEQVSHLTEAYYYERALENRLQMEKDQQLHVIPDTDEARLRLAISLGFEDWPSCEAVTNEHRNFVEATFQGLFTGEEEDEEDRSALNVIWFDSEMDNQADRLFIEWALGIGVREASAVLARINSFRRHPRIRTLNEAAARRVLLLLHRALHLLEPFGQQVVVFDRLLEVMSAIAGRQVYINLLLEYPASLQQLLRLCSVSDWFSAQIARYPILLDELIDPGRLSEAADRWTLATGLASVIDAVDADDLETQMEKLRQFKQTNLLRIAVLDVDERLSVVEVADGLSDLACVIVEQVLQLAKNAMVAKHGMPGCRVDGRDRVADIGVIAYGKLGGVELGYASDLDIVFLHDSQGERQQTSGREDGDGVIDNPTFFAKVAQRFIHIMETYSHSGRLYEIDTRLRPDGRAGLMTVSTSAFERYQLDKAWTWEHQALIRARPIAGGDTLREEFDRIRDKVLQQPVTCEVILKDVLAMRDKMRSHLAFERDGEFDIKQDHGGLVDIEFLAQAGVLCQAQDESRLTKTTSTLLLLDELEVTGWLSADETGTLRSAYVAYRKAVNREALNTPLTDREYERYRPAVSAIWQSKFGGISS